MTTQNKKRFYVYGSWEEQFEILTTEEKATMLMNLFKYQRGIEPTLDTTGLKLVWAGMKFLLEQDEAKYQAAVSRGEKAAQAKKSPAPTKQEPVPVKIKPEPIKWETETILHNWNHHDNVNDNVNDNEKGNVNIKMKSHTSSSIPGRSIPSNEQIEDILNW